MIRVRAELRLQVFMEDGSEKYDVVTSAEKTVPEQYRATSAHLKTVIQEAARQGLRPLKGSYVTQAMVELGPDEVGEIKRRALGFSLADARTHHHTYDDGELANHCLLCGLPEADVLHIVNRSQGAR